MTISKFSQSWTDCAIVLTCYTKPAPELGRTGEIMKAMFLGFAAAIIIAVVVGVAMTNMNTGTDQAFSTTNVRL